jgi:hypothetical protein
VKINVALIVLAILIVVGAGYLALHRRPDTWMGIRVDGNQSVKIGIYPTQNACKIEVRKVGGGCGRNCRDYGNGLIADCDPLISVSKAEDAGTP